MEEKIIVIGGGIGGLASSIEALKRGYEVHLFEKNPCLGGLCFSFFRKSHYIDGCLHWLTGTKEGTFLNKLWKEYDVLNDDVEIIKLDSLVSYKNKFHLYRSYEKSEEEWLRNASEDEEEIHHFFKMAKRFSMLQLASLNRPYELLSSDDVYSMVKEKYPKLLPFIDELRISRSEYALRFKNADLRFFIENAQVGYNDLFCLLFVYTKFVQGDVDIPSGGSLKMIERMKNLFLSLNGKLHLNEAVEEIIVDKGTAKGIKTNKGSYYSNYVIASLDPLYTLKVLLKGKFHCPKLEEAYLNKENYPLTSAFQLTFLLDENINIFEASNVIKTEPILIGKNEYVASLLRNYSYDKKYFSKNGKTIYHIFFNQNEDDYLFWKSLDQKSYKQEKERIALDIQKELFKQYPSLKENFEVIDTFTPLTISKYTNATCGAYMSFPVLGKKNAIFYDGKIEGLANFVFANQFLSSPGGLPNALINGKLAVSRLLNEPF